MFSQSIRLALAATILTLAVAESADARCIVNFKGRKAVFDDMPCYAFEGIPGVNGCVEFKAAPSGTQFPVEVRRLSGKPETTVIAATEIPCSDVGELARVGSTTTCSVLIAGRAEWRLMVAGRGPNAPLAQQVPSKN